MFINQAKPSWQIQGEFRLQRLEADTAAIRKRADAFHESEIQPLHKRRVDLQHQIHTLTDPTRRVIGHSVDNNVRLEHIARLTDELAAVNNAFTDAQTRHGAAQDEARAAIALLDRARTAWRNVAGGVGIGFEHKF